MSGTNPSMAAGGQVPGYGKLAKDEVGWIPTKLPLTLRPDPTSRSFGCRVDWVARSTHECWVSFLNPAYGVSLPVDCGIPWLGLVVYPTHRRVKARKVRQTSRRLGERLDAYQAGRISFAEFDAGVQGWINHVRAMPTPGGCVSMCWGDCDGVVDGKTPKPGVRGASRPAPRSGAQ